MLSSLLNPCRLQILLCVTALLGFVTSGVKASASNFLVSGVMCDRHYQAQISDCPDICALRGSGRLKN
jgi:hypothetical protein